LQVLIFAKILACYARCLLGFWRSDFLSVTIPDPLLAGGEEHLVTIGLSDKQRFIEDLKEQSLQKIQSWK